MGILRKIKSVFLDSKKDLKSIGKYNDIHKSTVFSFHKRISLGSYIYIGPNASINGLGGVEIKSGTIIGPNLIIHSANHNFENAKSIPYDETFVFKKVVIEENVWIGGNVIITPGTLIGEGSVIGAGCVVSGNIPPLSVVIGNPCKIIKKRNSQNYYALKRDNKIYMKLKKELKEVEPNFNYGFK